MAEIKTTRVAIVSEQAIYMRGLQSLVLSTHKLLLIGEARSSLEAIQLCQLSQPEMVLLDLKNDLSRWRETITIIKQRFPEITLILLLEPDSQAQEECTAMPTYCISRDVSEEEFKAALEQIQQDVERQATVPGMGKSSFDHTDGEDLNDMPLESQRLGRPSLQPRNEVIMERELVMAGRIQADILPEEAPKIPGYEVVASLVPAHETSGDFYDFIPLTGRKWGLVVADVTDKGMGAALFMALSSTLIRTYAVRFPTLPALTLSAVSDRLLSDTRGSMFVTAFYGILEPHTGRLVFANAGHPPGCLITTRKGRKSIDQLRPTGMALGVSDDAHWKQKEMRMGAGDVLILYTDGMTESQNARGEYYGDDRVIDAALGRIDGSAQEIMDALLADIHRFVGHAPRHDDIALIVVRRLE